MIASLAMYDRPETTAPTNRFWELIRDGLRRRGIAAPGSLTRGEAAFWPAWQAPDLVLSQTCGLPYRARLHDKVSLVATPDYGVEGCPPGHYRSVFVARADDPRDETSAFAGAPFAYNEALSQSGWAAAKAWFDQRGLDLVPALRTGAHAASAQAVREGRADFAAIDAVTWRLLSRHEAWTGSLKIVGTTDPTPGLPLIAAAGAEIETIYEALVEAFDRLLPEDRHSLGLKGLVRLSRSAYLALPIPAAPDQIAHRL